MPTGTRTVSTFSPVALPGFSFQRNNWKYDIWWSALPVSA